MEISSCLRARFCGIGAANSRHGAPHVPEILPADYCGAVAFGWRTFHMNSRHIVVKMLTWDLVSLAPTKYAVIK